MKFGKSTKNGFRHCLVERSRRSLDEIILYLNQHWSFKETTTFFNRLEAALMKIQNSPQRYKNSLRNPPTKEFQLSSHTTLFYSYNETTVNILLIWANKRDPKNMI